jgi:hypothetical protein
MREFPNISEKPTKFYKYHKINPYLYNLLEQGNFWYSHQNELNDPFDCKYTLSENYLNSILQKSSTQLVSDLQRKSKLFDGLTPDGLLKFMRPTLESNESINMFYDMLFGEMLGWNVCCFTTSPINELMWSHYADNYKGVCLEFDLTKSPELHDKIYPVEYNNATLEINSVEELPDALFRKRKVWSYEDEWRMLTNVNGEKYFNKEALTAIYFGCNVKKATIDNIREVLRISNYKVVDFKQVSLRINGINLNNTN